MLDMFFTPLMVNPLHARRFGVCSAVLIAFMIEQQDYESKHNKNNGMWHLLDSDIMYSTGLTHKELAKSKKQLVKLGVMLMQKNPIDGNLFYFFKRNEMKGIL